MNEGQFHMRLSQGWSEVQGLQGELLGLRHRYEGTDLHGRQVVIGQAGVGRSIIGVDSYGLLEVFAGLALLGAGSFIQVPSLKVSFMSCWVYGPAARQSRLLLWSYGDVNFIDNRACHFPLHDKEILQIALVGLGPDLGIG